MRLRGVLLACLVPACAAELPAPPGKVDGGDGASGGATTASGPTASGTATHGTGDGGGFMPPSDVGATDDGVIDSYAEDIEEIWILNCVIYCHGYPNFEADLDLDWGQGYGELVDQPSIQSDLLLVVPFDPDASYLWHKLEGTQLEVGGAGERMPSTNPDPLEAKLRETIRTWIEIGAPP